MEALNVILLLFMIVCAIAVAATKNLLAAVITFMAQGLAMSVVWMLLQSPDLAITEAAVGAALTPLIFIVTLKKIRGGDDK